MTEEKGKIEDLVTNPVEDPERSRRERSQGEPSRKVVEKYYIEVNPSAKLRFLYGLLGGLGWGIGLTIGTAVIIYALGIFISKIDFVPILGSFLADVIKSAQGNLNTR